MNDSKFDEALKTILSAATSKEIQLAFAVIVKLLEASDNEGAQNKCEKIIQAGLIPHIKEILVTKSLDSDFPALVLVNVSYHNSDILVENGIHSIFVEMLTCADDTLFKQLALAIGNIAARCDDICVLVDAASLLDVLVDRLTRDFSDGLIFELTHAVSCITYHQMPFASVVNTLLALIKLFKESRRYSKKVNCFILLGISHITVRNREATRYLCENEWECIEKILCYLNDESDDDVNYETVSLVIYEALGQVDNQKIMRLVGMRLFDLFVKNLKSAEYTTNLLQTIGFLARKDSNCCKALMAHTTLIRTLLDLFSNIALQQEIGLTLANFLAHDSEVVIEYAPFLVDNGFLELLGGSLQLGARAWSIFSLKALLDAGELLVDNESILFNQFTLRFAESGGREILLEITSSQNALTAEIRNSALCVFTEHLGDKFDNFMARKRGFKIKKAL